MTTDTNRPRSVFDELTSVTLPAHNLPQPEPWNGAGAAQPHEPGPPEALAPGVAAGGTATGTPTRVKQATQELLRLGLLYAEAKPNLYQAVLAGKPLDPANAHYGLAVAYKSLNKMADAKEEVISSLEAAPGFKPAQKLLLELSGKE